MSDTQIYTLSSSEMNKISNPLESGLYLISIIINVPFLILFIFLTKKYKTGFWHWLWLIATLITSYNIINAIYNIQKNKN
jgi:hypothetical protein